MAGGFGEGGPQSDRALSFPAGAPLRLARHSARGRRRAPAAARVGRGPRTAGQGKARGQRMAMGILSSRAGRAVAATVLGKRRAPVLSVPPGTERAAA
jgi:hypothetical protein